MEVNKMYAKLCINDRCNMRCKYCFLPKNRQPELSEEAWVLILHKLKNLGVEEIDFFGKEPLYDRKAFNVLEEAIRQTIAFSSVTMITNGVNVSKYKSEILQYLNSLTISMGDDKHDFRSDMGGACNITYMKGILQNIVPKIPVEISIDVSNNNINNIRNYAAIYEDMGVSSIFLKPIMPIGKNARKAAKYAVSESDFERLCEGILLHPVYGIDFRVHIPFYFERLTQKYRDFDGDFGIQFITEPVCSCDGNGLYINSSGVCYPCGFCDIMQRTETGFDFLSTSNSEIKDLITSDGKRFCGR